MNIKISRYDERNLPDGAACADGSFFWEASVEAEDGSWVLFVPKDPKMSPQLFIRVSIDDNGEEAYAPAAVAELAG